MTEKTRPIEMFVAYANKKWDTVFVQIPVDTPEAKIEAVASARLEKQLLGSADGVAFTGVYWIPEIERVAKPPPKVDTIDRRLLCPRCKDGLYASLEGFYSGIPVFAGKEDDSYGMSCWDILQAKHSEVDLVRLDCQTCGFWISQEDMLSPGNLERHGEEDHDNVHDCS